MNGRVAVITGATSGIGFETARALTDKGFLVIGTGRSQKKCEQAAAAIRAEQPSAAKSLRFVICDLASFNSVRAAAVEIEQVLCSEGRGGNKSRGALEVLINNAGTVSHRRIETDDGHELQWQVNHLSPCLLTQLLLPCLKHSAQQLQRESRIITVASQSHRGARIHWKDPNLRRGYNPLRAYKQSKLANVLFTYEFNRRRMNRQRDEEMPVRAFAVDPGLVNTEIGHKNSAGPVYWIWTLRQHGGVSPAEGAATSLYLASAASDELREAARGDVGANAYWKNCRPIRSSRYSYKLKAAQRLWALSVQMCGITDFTEMTGKSDE